MNKHEAPQAASSAGGLYGSVVRRSALTRLHTVPPIVVEESSGEQSPRLVVDRAIRERGVRGHHRHLVTYTIMLILPFSSFTEAIRFGRLGHEATRCSCPKHRPRQMKKLQTPLRERSPHTSLSIQFSPAMHLCTNPEFNLLSTIHSFSPAFSSTALQLLCTPTKLQEMRFSFWLVPSRAVPNRSIQDAEITNHYWGYEVVWCAYSRCFGCQVICRLHASERYAQRRIVCRSTAHHRFSQTKRFGVRAALVSSHASRAPPDAEDLGRFYCCRGRTPSSHRWRR